MRAMIKKNNGPPPRMERKDAATRARPANFHTKPFLKIPTALMVVPARKSRHTFQPVRACQCGRFAISREMASPAGTTGALKDRVVGEAKWLEFVVFRARRTANMMKMAAAAVAKMGAKGTRPFLRRSATPPSAMRIKRTGRWMERVCQPVGVTEEDDDRRSPPLATRTRFSSPVTVHSPMTRGASRAGAVRVGWLGFFARAP